MGGFLIDCDEDPEFVANNYGELIYSIEEKYSKHFNIKNVSYKYVLFSRLENKLCQRIESISS